MFVYDPVQLPAPVVASQLGFLIGSMQPQCNALTEPATVTTINQRLHVVTIKTRAL